jgi:hypothetical protein
VLLFDIWQMSLPDSLHGDSVHHTAPQYTALEATFIKNRNSGRVKEGEIVAYFLEDQSSAYLASLAFVY